MGRPPKGPACGDCVETTDVRGASRHQDVLEVVAEDVMVLGCCVQGAAKASSLHFLVRSRSVCNVVVISLVGICGISSVSDPYQRKCRLLRRQCILQSS